MCLVLIFDSDLINCELIICLSLKGTIATRWTGLGKLLNFVGQPAIGAVYGMEKRNLEPTLGVLKERVGLMRDRLPSIVLYMSSNKSTVVGIQREIKSARTEQTWSSHVLYRDAVIKDVVHPSRVMPRCSIFAFLLFCRVYFDLSSEVAEIWSSLTPSCL